MDSVVFEHPLFKGQIMNFNSLKYTDMSPYCQETMVRVPECSCGYVSKNVVLFMLRNLNNIALQADKTGHGTHVMFASQYLHHSLIEGV